MLCLLIFSHLLPSLVWASRASLALVVGGGRGLCDAARALEGAVLAGDVVVAAVGEGGADASWARCAASLAAAGGSLCADAVWPQRGDALRCALRAAVAVAAEGVLLADLAYADAGSAADLLALVAARDAAAVRRHSSWLWALARSSAANLADQTSAAGVEAAMRMASTMTVDPAPIRGLLEMVATGSDAATHYRRRQDTQQEAPPLRHLTVVVPVLNCTRSALADTLRRAMAAVRALPAEPLGDVEVMAVVRDDAVGAAHADRVLCAAHAHPYARGDVRVCVAADARSEAELSVVGIAHARPESDAVVLWGERAARRDAGQLVTLVAAAMGAAPAAAAPVVFGVDDVVLLRRAAAERVRGDAAKNGLGPTAAGLRTLLPALLRASEQEQREQQEQRRRRLAHGALHGRQVISTAGVGYGLNFGCAKQIGEQLVYRGESSEFYQEFLVPPGINRVAVILLAVSGTEYAISTETSYTDVGAGCGAAAGIGADGLLENSTSVVVNGNVVGLGSSTTATPFYIRVRNGSPPSATMQLDVLFFSGLLIGDSITVRSFARSDIPPPYPQQLVELDRSDSVIIGVTNVLSNLTLTTTYNPPVTVITSTPHYAVPPFFSQGEQLSGLTYHKPFSFTSDPNLLAACLLQFVESCVEVEEEEMPPSLLPVINFSF